MILTLLASIFVRPIIKFCPLSLEKAIAKKFEERYKPQKRDAAMEALDGKFIACEKCGSYTGECGKPNSGFDSPPKHPDHGKRPEKCGASKLPKVVFVNGIDNSPIENCQSSQKLSNTMCAEVVSFYNSTDGRKGDLSECVSNITGDPNNIPARNLEKFLKDNKDEEITIVAHSQGGLITRQALRARQNDLTDNTNADDAVKKMSKIKVISCGTAENGWPEGPIYEQYTNKMDIVPKVIAEADKAFDIPSTQPANTKRNQFFNFSGDKLLGHGMNEVYLPKIEENQAGSIPVNDCVSCPKKSYLKSA